MASNLRVDSIVPSTSANVSIGTATGGVTIPGDLGIAGVLTYEDVTNIDSVGVITARAGLNVAGDVSIADKIIHTGDTNTAIRFPANDVISFERSGGEALRITTAGSILTNGATSEPLYPGYTTARKVQAEIKGAIDVGQTRHHGSLAINCTNENAALHLVRSQANNTSGVDAGLIAFTVYDGTDFHQCARIMASRDAAGGDNDTPGRLTFHTTADGASSATERMRIHQNGAVSIANTRNYYGALNVEAGVITSGSSAIDIKASGTDKQAISFGDHNTISGELRITNSSNISLGTSSNHPFIFYTGASRTERLRITSDGKLLYGTTTDYFGGTGVGVSGQFSVGDGTRYRRMYQSGNGHFYFWNGSNQPYISSSGNWTNSSDVNLKKDINDLSYGIDSVKNLKPRKFKMKSNDITQIGFIAQEVESVVPEVVDAGETPNGDQHKGLAYGNLTAVLTKALQEAVTKIETLEAKVAALEGS